MTHPTSSAQAGTMARTAGQKFEDRFTWNEVFSCSAEDELLNIGVGGISGSDARRLGLTAEQQHRSLDVDVFRAAGGQSQRWFHSWGEAAFDSDEEGRLASVKLANGKRVEFHRFGPLPDPDASEAAFDRKPFFTMTVDGKKYRCGLEFNPR
ncbi:hypothetical protein [Vulcaniibacterium tengchongense]|uniref:hypothetical protein n=1 Tax=Vulcaniibacterium tengchongense TaxID=1273429 RepID=UPI000F4F1F61|nr:hypothetical protein [Vulcaniibacterium tengchongense]